MTPVTVLGPPGAGKTTWCNQIAQAAGGVKLISLDEIRPEGEVRRGAADWETWKDLLKERSAMPYVIDSSGGMFFYPEELETSVGCLILLRPMIADPVRLQAELMRRMRERVESQGEITYVDQWLESCEGAKFSRTVDYYERWTSMGVPTIEVPVR